MSRHSVDLSEHINQDARDESTARFPVSLRPLLYRRNGSLTGVPTRLAVVRDDTGDALAVVSDRYTLVPHGRILDAVSDAIGQTSVRPVPRGVYTDRGGARMRALYKFPSLARPVLGDDLICPCIKIENTYDATSRITLHIGAFRFVCTNLAVGGGGVFAGGFMAVHQGEIPVQQIAEQLGSYLSGFDTIVGTYRAWSGQPAEQHRIDAILKPLPKRTSRAIREEIAAIRRDTVYAAYNACTRVATHRMRSFRTAFDLLERINRGFQEAFPPSRN